MSLLHLPIFKALLCIQDPLYNSAIRTVDDYFWLLELIDDFRGNLFHLVVDTDCSNVIAVIELRWERVMWVTELIIPMRVRAIVAKFANAFLQKVLAHLGLVVVVGNVHHLELNLHG